MDSTQKIGLKKYYIASVHRGKGKLKSPTKKQIEELKKLGINLEKIETDSVQEFIDTLNQMKSTGVDVSKIKQRDTIETLAKKSGIDRKKIEEIGLDPAQKIGVKKNNITRAYRGKGTSKSPTKEQEEELKKLGISLEKLERDSVQEFIDTLKQLKSIGIDVSKIGKKDTIETLAKKSGIGRKELEEIGLDLMQKIGQKKANIRQAHRGKSKNKPPTNEQVEELKKLGISLEYKKRTSKEIAEASICSLTDIEMSDREDATLKELVEKTKEGGMNLDEQS